MKKGVVIVGAQWGDEGKGKIVDWLTHHLHAVVRFQGGHNAGHTLTIGDNKIVLRLIPSGALRPHISCYLGNGMVVSLPELFKEIQELETKAQIALLQRIFISTSANLILPYHTAIDIARESSGTPETRIGTTKRGIGPAYEDKVARRGLRVQDLFYPKHFSDRVKTALEYHNFILKNYYQVATIDAEPVIDTMLSCAEKLKPLVCDTAQALAAHYAKGERILFEGAQGTMLDIDHGTYPFVTSSNTVAANAACGSGVAPQFIDYVLGICKAYTTRVGAGPFPSELKDAVGAHIAKAGNEFGSVTGRPRRCGWFDAPLVRQAALNNGIQSLCLTKLDVLDALDEIKVVVAYRNAQGQRLTHLPCGAIELSQIQVEYETFKGWRESTFGINEFDRLPRAAQTYVKQLEAITGIDISMISTGPERMQTIMRENPLALSLNP